MHKIKQFDKWGTVERNQRLITLIDHTSVVESQKDALPWKVNDLFRSIFLIIYNTKTLAKLLTDRWRRLCPSIGPAGPSNPGALLKQRSKHLLRWREEGSDLGLAQDAQGGSRDWGRHGRDPSWSHRRGRICDGVFQVQLDQVLFSKFDGVYQVGSCYKLNRWS